MRKSRPVPIKNKPKYALVVDGECEYWYFNMLKRNEKTIAVDLRPEIPTKKKLEEQYNKVLELSKDYDKVFWIIDLDVINNETRLAKTGARTALQKMRQYHYDLNTKHSNKVTVIINNPCLEYWLLLHFEPTTKYFNNCEDATRQLSRHLNNYQKTQGYFTKQDNDIYLKLRHLLNRASENAQKLGDFDFDNPYSGMTQMHLLFEELGIIKFK
jgi:hypothetical protein